MDLWVYHSPEISGEGQGLEVQTGMINKQPNYSTFVHSFIHSFKHSPKRLSSSVFSYKTVLIFKSFYFRDNLLCIMQSSHSGIDRTQQYIYTQEKMPYLLNSLSGW